MGGCLTVDSHGGGTTRRWDLDVSWPHLPIVLSAPAPRLPSMWESSEALWRRLNLGRAEYLQRLDEMAHDDGPGAASAVPEAFLDEYLQARGSLPSHTSVTPMIGSMRV